MSLENIVFLSEGQSQSAGRMKRKKHSHSSMCLRLHAGVSNRNLSSYRGKIASQEKTTRLVLLHYLLYSPRF